MLKGVHPLVGPELLTTLARMGHGDVLLVVDRNYPAYAAGVPVHRVDGVGVVEAVAAVLTLLPVDDFVPEPVFRMSPVEDPQLVTPVQREVAELVARVERRSVSVEAVERHAFYERARRAAAVLVTGETQAYGCFGIVKGVVREDEPG